MLLLSGCVGFFWTILSLRWVRKEQGDKAMPQPENIDQRNEKRRVAKEQSFVQYQITELDGKPKSHASPLNDYSASGIRLVCHEPVAVGQVLQLDVFLQGEQQPLHLTGEIRWCLEVDEIPTYHAGVSFVEDDSQDFKRWRKVVQDTLN
jgi:hypothetical protein